MKFRMENTQSTVYLTEEKGRYYVQEKSWSGGKSPKTRIGKQKYEDLQIELKK